MHFAVAFFILTLSTSSTFTAAIKLEMILDIQEDINNYNASCPPDDTCKEERKGDSMKYFDCQCSSVCVFHGTCCIDSPYASLDPPKVRPNCRTTDNRRFYYMVDRCPESVSKDSIWESLCQEEWHGGNEEIEMMQIVPVTSVFTRITYKNYFCFRCNEIGDDFQYWPVELGSDDYEFDESIDQSSVSLSYDTTYKTWVAPLGKGGILVPVNVDISTPEDINPLPETCLPGVISRCAYGWNDTDVSDKCEAYMGLMEIQEEDQIFVYKNVHCALCNFEDLSYKECYSGTLYAFRGKVPFSFTHLLDVNPTDGDEVGKIRRCRDNFLWDPYAKKCRKLTCALPGYVVRDGKCTPP